MSAVVSPASAMARSAASTVRSMPVRYSRRPMSDWAAPLMTARRSEGSAISLASGD